MRKSDRKPFMRKSKEKNTNLEEETKRMEERLQMLKSVLYKDLPKRTQSSETIWNGSKGKEIIDARPKPSSLLDMSRVKLKTLKHENIEVKMDHHYSDLISKVMKSTEKYTMPEEKASFTKCGQCEIKQASVSCQECNENYCARCFAQFHMKGALRRHHSLPLSRYKTRRVSVADDHPPHLERGEQAVEDIQPVNSQKTVVLNRATVFGRL
ncbi:unnamed protein product [Calicophoron daubneyi]|uniref:B box-type domain-containing protein n=1 Tax=Calicophoron daubneyi TaxID=300641 RepID=A0AAV2TWP3_CALDB